MQLKTFPKELVKNGTSATKRKYKTTDTISLIGIIIEATEDLYCFKNGTPTDPIIREYPKKGIT